jgi:hypothetical protein
LLRLKRRDFLSQPGEPLDLTVAALEKPPPTFEGRIIDPPETRSDNVSCYTQGSSRGC